MNKYQEKAHEAYPDDLIQLYADFPGTEYGDSLARLIANELEDVVSKEEAITRLARALAELSSVMAAIAEIEE